MDELKLQVAMFQKELGQVVKELALKHNLTLAKNSLRYDQYQWKTNLTFNVNGKQGELKALEANLFSNDGDPKIGDVLGYRRTSYKVTGYNRNGTLLASRTVDGRGFKFKRNRITGKYDYFDVAVVA